MPQSKILLLALILLISPQLTHASWDDFFNEVKKTVKKETENTAKPSLSEKTIAAGLKQALNKGISKSVKQLGQKNGFLHDASVKIPMPKTLKDIDKGLRAIGQSKTADKFINTMNHAAERAVTNTIDILVDAVKSMTLKDVVNILNGEDDAATQYFKRTKSAHLRTTIKPIIHKATNTAGITESYKQMIKKSGFLARFFDKDSLDIDEYITNRTLDALFLKISIEEKRIRKDPLARTTDLLKTVFGN